MKNYLFNTKATYFLNVFFELFSISVRVETQEINEGGVTKIKTNLCVGFIILYL